METIEFKDTEVPIIRIPKGTLLFRATKHAEMDYVGRDLGGRLCIPPNYNVFFYYTPFAIDSVNWYDQMMNIEVCVTTKELKIVSLISPSKYTRTTRYDESQPFLVPCNSDKLKKACFKSRQADPCFQNTFIEEFPDIVGYTSIAKEDADRLMAAVKRGKLKKYAKYIPLTTDDRGVEGTPEVVLYPLAKRQPDSIYIDHPESFKGNNEYNYKYVTSLNRNCDDREKFMKQHAVLKEGKYYMYKA
jgi:hypothetical protein